ncbi:MAG: hypothetical protein EOP83_15175, partial [Verrucomicrobiaceae bacterium]
MPSGVLAAPKGTVIAGALTTGSAESPHTLPFVWANDEAEPRTLPRPDGYDQAIVSALNSRGDVAGLVGGRGLPNRAVIWRADGTIAYVPVGAWNASRSPKAGPYSAAEPRLLTEDGVLIGRETSKDAPWGFVTTYWDGRRTLWFPDAVAGVRIVNLESLRLTADGRGFLAHVWDGKAWG